MAIFDNNKFRPEEQLGGFKVGIEDNDLFFLNEIDEYPGILPNFEFEEQSISQLIALKEGIPYDRVNKSIDLSDGNKVEPIIDVSPIEVPNNNFDDFGESFISSKQNNDDDLEPLSTYRQNNFDDDEEINFGSPINYNIEKRNKNYDNNDYNPNNENEIDTDLNALLKDSINSSKERKKNAIDEETIDSFSMFDNMGISNTEELNPEDFNVVYDFDDIKASSPSKMGLADIEEENPNAAINNEEEDKKKKKKGLATWKIIAISVAATLVLASIIGLVVMKFLNKTKEHPTELVKNDNKHNKEHNKKQDKKHDKNEDHNESDNKVESEYDTSQSRKSELIAENDDVKVELKVEVKPEHKDTHKTSEDKNSKIADKGHNTEANQKNEKQANFEGKITFKDKPNEHLAINSKDKNVIKKVSDEHKTDNHKVDNHKTDSHKPLEKINKVDLGNHSDSKKDSHSDKHKEVKKETKKEPKKENIAKIIENETFFEQPKNENKKSEKSEKLSVSNTEKPKEQIKVPNESQNEIVEEVYSVQVYSTLSKSDAMDMVEKVKKMGIYDAFISKQNIRDEVWYRVRYGNFGSKDEAKTSASKYGFSQIWIDRLK